MAREPIPTWYFAMVVVRLGHRFLLVHEKKHGQRWYLPAGRVEPGETLVEGAERETLEESGIPVTIEGVLRVEHTPQPSGGARCRVFFIARPKGDCEPLAEPNEHSLKAAWVSLKELDAYPLRGHEVADVFRYVEQGGQIHPLSVLTFEGAGWG